MQAVRCQRRDHSNVLRNDNDYGRVDRSHGRMRHVGSRLHRTIAAILGGIQFLADLFGAPLRRTVVVSAGNLGEL